MYVKNFLISHEDKTGRYFNLYGLIEEIQTLEASLEY